MRLKTASILALTLISALASSAAQAATPLKIGSPCTKVGATTVSNGVNYSCIKALTGKMVWSNSTQINIKGAKPQIPGVRGGDDGGPGGHKGAPGAGDVGRKSATKRYNACLFAHGGVTKGATACAAFAPQHHPEGNE